MLMLRHIKAKHYVFYPSEKYFLYLTFTSVGDCILHPHCFLSVFLWEFAEKYCKCGLWDCIYSFTILNSRTDDVNCTSHSRRIRWFIADRFNTNWAAMSLEEASTIERASDDDELARLQESLDRIEICRKSSPCVSVTEDTQKADLLAMLTRIVKVCFCSIAVPCSSFQFFFSFFF